MRSTPASATPLRRKSSSSAREKAQREGAGQPKRFTDSELLREVMNTVGKEGRLGEQIRCVVSVAMLTEGWDTNTVTHILGVRAFGTQLLCEQVIGRGLRRQLTTRRDTRPRRPPAARRRICRHPRHSVRLRDRAGRRSRRSRRSRSRASLRCKERAALAIRFPRVAGYRTELPDDRFDARFHRGFPATPSTLTMSGPSKARLEGIVGEGHDISPETLDEMRPSDRRYAPVQATGRALFPRRRGIPPYHLVGKLQPITRALALPNA